jgi:hypothetical protein
MTDSRNLVDEVVRVQKLASPSSISDQQLAIYKIVPNRVVSLQQTVQFGSVGHPIRKETNPNGSIYEYHQAAALLLPLPGLRLGTSVAPVSEPLSLRSLS